MNRFFRCCSLIGSIFVLGSVSLSTGYAETTKNSAIGMMTEAPQVEEGLWLVEEKDGVFRIAPCLNHHERLCGWLVGMDYTEAEPAKDVWGRSQCGLQIIFDMKQANNKRWNGHILDPRTGHMYRSQLWVTQDNRLKVLGYIGITLLGQVQTWSRYHGASIGEKCRMR